eukprot:501113_1
MSACWDTECLVFGFIIQHILKEYETKPLVPLEIYYLFILFFPKITFNQHLCLLNGSMVGPNSNKNKGNIINLKTFHKYSMEIYNVEKNISKKKKSLFNCCYGMMSCSVSNTIIPGWLYNKLKDPFNYNDGKIPKSLQPSVLNTDIIMDNQPTLNKDGYNMIFINDKSTKIGLYIFHSKQLNPNNNKISAYYHSLPSIIIGQPDAIICDNDTCTLYAFTNTWNINIHEICLNIDNINALNWCDTSIKQKNTIYSNTNCFIKQNNMKKIALIGEKKLEICCVKSKTTEVMKVDMNKDRSFGGCAYSQYKNWIVVGGSGKYNMTEYMQFGSAAANTIEYLDLNSLKQWNYLGKNTNNLHCNNPCIWFDNINPNILYIGGDKINNGKYNELGNIEYCDIRQEKWNVLKSSKLLKLFKIKNKTTDFRSRSLLKFM